MASGVGDADSARERLAMMLVVMRELLGCVSVLAMDPRREWIW